MWDITLGIFSFLRSLLWFLFLYQSFELWIVSQEFLLQVGRQLEMHDEVEVELSIGSLTSCPGRCVKDLRFL